MTGRLQRARRLLSAPWDEEGEEKPEGDRSVRPALSVCDPGRRLTPSEARTDSWRPRASFSPGATGDPLRRPLCEVSGRKKTPRTVSRPSSPVNSWGQSVCFNPVLNGPSTALYTNPTSKTCFKIVCACVSSVQHVHESVSLSDTTNIR